MKSQSFNNHEALDILTPCRPNFPHHTKTSQQQQQQQQQSTTSQKRNWSRQWKPLDWQQEQQQMQRQQQHKPRLSQQRPLQQAGVQWTPNSCCVVVVIETRTIVFLVATVGEPPCVVSRSSKSHSRLLPAACKQAASSRWTMATKQQQVHNGQKQVRLGTI